MALPNCEGEHHCLPYRDNPYRATLDEIEEHFVDAAPEEARFRRGLIMRALRLFCDITTKIAENQNVTLDILINGGFTTWKEAPPRDVDVAVFIPPASFAHFTKEPLLPLWTLSDASATLGGDGGLKVASADLIPGFGLTDCYVAPDLPAARQRWHNNWSAVRHPETREIVEGAKKGYVEVVMT